MRKQIVAIALVITLTMCCIGSAYAHGSAGEHWQDLRLVLFGDTHYRGQTQKTDDLRIILERASSLCIDQFGGSSSSYLEQLRLKGVKNLPATIAEIDLDATAMNHRSFTHLGWNAPYSGDARNPEWAQRWAVRRNILRNSVEHVFNFKDERQKEAFCGLLYYVHILGDHIEFKYGTYGTGKDQVILIAGGHGQVTFISELLDVLAILFNDQKNSYHYMLMVRELRTEEILLNALLNQTYIPSLYMDQVNAADTDEMDDAQMLALLNEPERMDTPELFAASYTAHAKRILEILSRHVPYLLQEEAFFNMVFSDYSGRRSGGLFMSYISIAPDRHHTISICFYISSIVSCTHAWYNDTNLSGGISMSVRYNKLWKMLIDLDMTRVELRSAAQMSPNTLAKLGKNEDVSLDVLKRICGVLKCDIGDIMEIIPESQVSDKA